jgi:hypothetical protein
MALDPASADIYRLAGARRVRVMDLPDAARAACGGSKDTFPSYEPTTKDGQFKGPAMIPNLTVIVSFYVVTKMVELIARKPEGIALTWAKTLAWLTMLATAAALLDTLLSGVNVRNSLLRL